MSTSLYTAYSALQSDMRALDVAANNLANVNTNGYREQRSFITALEVAGQSYPSVGGTEEWTEPGPFVNTGRDLDVAIEGQGFLVVETADGRRYTRDGGLSLNEEGLLVTRDGSAVVGQGGRVQLEPGKVEIDPDGRVTVSGVQAGRLLLVRVPQSSLVREAAGLYRSTDGSETPATEDRLKQGFIERSNVELPSGDIMQLRRHFQSLSRALQTVNSLERRLITTARGG